MIKVTLDYDSDPDFCGSSVWFETLEEAFAFIKGQLEVSAMAFYIEEE